MKNLKAIEYVNKAMFNAKEALKSDNVLDMKRRLEIIQLSCSIALDDLNILENKINNLT